MICIFYAFVAPPQAEILFHLPHCAPSGHAIGMTLICVIVAPLMRSGFRYTIDSPPHRRAILLVAQEALVS